MGCGGSKKTHAVDETESEQEDYDQYHTKNKSSSPRREKYNNNTNYDNYNSPRGKQSNNTPRYGNYNSTASTQAYSRGTQSIPESRYAVSSNGSNYDDFPEANDRQGYKKRIRNELIQATSGTSIEAIEKSIEKFEKNHLEDCGDLTRARDRLQFLKLKRDLRDSIRRSNVGVLERTIAEAKGSRYSGQLRNQIEAAQRKLAHLKELNKYNHDILTMDQSTISEIHSYHRPPACVHDVMAASYMLLGHEEPTLRDWSYLQSMAGKVGRDSLIHQVRDFDSSNVDEKTAARVREILNYHDLGEVRVASNGAATFHVWASNIVDLVEKDHEEDYERQRRLEKDKLRREEDEESDVPKELPPKESTVTKGKRR